VGQHSTDYPHILKLTPIPSPSFTFCSIYAGMLLLIPRPLPYLASSAPHGGNRFAWWAGRRRRCKPWITPFIAVAAWAWRHPHRPPTSTARDTLQHSLLDRCYCVTRATAPPTPVTAPPERGMRPLTTSLPARLPHLPAPFTCLRAAHPTLLPGSAVGRELLAGSFSTRTGHTLGLCLLLPSAILGTRWRHLAWDLWRCGKNYMRPPAARALRHPTTLGGGRRRGAGQ